MAQWYVQELSKLTKVSVRTLHHYDAIGLLTPSHRLPNGYRGYTESDLFRLQQIIALRSFGFALTRIKELLGTTLSMRQSLKAQQAVLQEQIAHLQSVSKTLTTVLDEVQPNESIDWHKVIQLMEVYTMTKDLAQTWMGKVFDTQQIKDLAALSASRTQEFWDDYHKRWQALVDDVALHMQRGTDPASPVGKKLCLAWFDLINEVYGHHPQLREALRDAYLQERIPKDANSIMVSISKEMFDWIGKAKETHKIKA